jgi:hypothetical protein
MTKHEKILEKEHQRYLKNVNESGMPMWIFHQYSSGPTVPLQDTNNSSLKERSGNWISKRIEVIKATVRGLFNLKPRKELPF